MFSGGIRDYFPGPDCIATSGFTYTDRPTDRPIGRPDRPQRPDLPDRPTHRSDRATDLDRPTDWPSESPTDRPTDCWFPTAAGTDCIHCDADWTNLSCAGHAYIGIANDGLTMSGWTDHLS